MAGSQALGFTCALGFKGLVLGFFASAGLRFEGLGFSV